MIHVIFHRLFATLVLAAALQAYGVDDHDLAGAAVSPGPVVTSGPNGGANSPIQPDLSADSKVTDASPSGKIDPDAPAKVKGPVSPATAPAAMDFQEPVSPRNPWLYIIIGFLLVTGVFLYVDPKLF